MGLHTSFDRLSAVVEQYERGGRSVRSVEATTDDGGRLHATLEVPVSICAAESGELRPALSPTRATLTDDGALQVEFATAEATTLPASATVEEQTVRVTDGGDILLRVDLVVDPAGCDSSDTVDETDVEDEKSRAPDDGVASRQSADASEGDTDTGTDDEATPDTEDDTESGADAEAESGDDDTEPPESAASAESAGDAELAAVRDESVPPYEDTAYLQRLYDTSDTFAEMSRRIEMDVAGETVRRYMIDAGVHTPSSYETATDESATGEADVEEASETATAAGQSETTSVETPVDGSRLPDEQLVTDGIGLPEEIRIEDVAEAVTVSSTVYDVQRRLDLEGEQTWELLQQLDLLDLLVGRISDGRERSISYESVTDRIRRSTACGA